MPKQPVADPTPHSNTRARNSAWATLTAMYSPIWFASDAPTVSGYCGKLHAPPNGENGIRMDWRTRRPEFSVTLSIPQSNPVMDYIICANASAKEFARFGRRGGLEDFPTAPMNHVE